VQLRETHYGADHIQVGRALNGLAQLHMENKHEAEAEPLFRRAVPIYEKAHDYDIDSIFLNQILLYGHLGKDAEMKTVQERSRRFHGQGR